jgi:hypothetical protein
MLINNKHVNEEQLLGQLMECGVPDGCHGGLIRYILYGVPTGSFLQAVLSNDLMEAFGRADIFNRAGMFSIVSFLYNHAPSQCYGSPEKYSAWLTARQKEYAQEKEHGPQA